VRIFLCVANWEDQPKSLDAVGAKNRLFGFSNLWDEPFTRRTMMNILRGLSRVKGNGEMLMIDSGVAVLNNRYFAAGVVRRRGKFPFDQEEMERLVTKYALLLKAGVQAGVIDCAVEMDVDHFVGYEKVKEYRRRFEDTGVKLLPVWRPTLGEEAYEELVRSYDWIALSEGIAGISINSSQTVEFVQKLVADGVKRGKKFHFFAGLRRSLLFTCPLYSADSTTWCAFSRWALTTHFDPESKWIQWRCAGEGVKAYKHSRQIGVKGISFNPLSSLYVDAVAARAYGELEDYVTKYWAGKGVTFDA